MKKLRLSLANFEGVELLSRDQLKKITGGDGSETCLGLGATGCGWPPSSSTPGHSGTYCCSGYVCAPTTTWPFTTRCIL